VGAQLRFKDGRLRLPMGAIEGQHLNFVLHDLVAHASRIRDFDQLPIPFRAVAADIVTGEAVVLARGDLALAMRASMSIPGVFTPMELEGRLLVDGGIAKNIPVDVAQSMGVDRLVVVDIGTPLAPREQLGDVLALVDQLSNIMTRSRGQTAMAMFSRLLDLFCRLVIIVAGSALVGLVAMMGWLVFGRYVLNDTPTWVERGATLAILCIALPVAAVGVRERFHLSVLSFREALPRAVQRWIAVGCDTLVGLFGFAMMVHSWELVAMVWNFRIPLLGISQGWTYVPLMVCGGLITLFAIEQVLLDILRKEGPEQRGIKAAFLE